MEGKKRKEIAVIRCNRGGRNVAAGREGRVEGKEENGGGESSKNRFLYLG